MIEEAMDRLYRLRDRGVHANLPYKLLHTHIPKTAGMSLLDLFKRQFSPHLHLPWERAGTVWSEFVLKSLVPKFTTGHITFAEAMAPSGASSLPIYFVTVIRDPAMRALSLYNYGRSEEYPDNIEFFKTYPSIDQYFVDLSKDRNSQSKWLCGKVDDPEVLTVILGKHYCGIAPLDFVDSYAISLQNAFSEGKPQQLSTENELRAIVHGEKATLSDVSKQVLQVFSEANSLDYKLYSLAMEYWSKNELSPVC